MRQLFIFLVSSTSKSKSNKREIKLKESLKPTRSKDREEEFPELKI